MFEITSQVSRQSHITTLNNESIRTVDEDGNPVFDQCGRPVYHEAGSVRNATVYRDSYIIVDDDTKAVRVLTRRLLHKIYGSRQFKKARRRWLDGRRAAAERERLAAGKEGE